MIDEAQREPTLTRRTDRPRGATRYRSIRRQIANGDLIIFNRASLHATAARSTASHAATAVWRGDDCGDTLSIAESREGFGGRVVSLSGEIRKYPLSIDVYTPSSDCTPELRHRAATIAYRWAGHAYPYPQIAEMALSHFPILAAVLRLAGYEPDYSDMSISAWAAAKVCSQLHAWAYRWAKRELAIGQIFSGRDYNVDLPADKITAAALAVKNYRASGWDPVPNLGDKWIEPADLVRGCYVKKFEGLYL